MKRLTLFLLYLLFPLSLLAQEGTWSGKLDVGGQKLRLVFHLSQQSDGWHATMDSPDQGVKGIPVDSVALSPLGLTMSIKALAMSYTGGFMGKDNLVGALNQH
ncbi:MAG: alpha/beta hydrolase, partial [Alistipes sp.]|nr:alpha/beta hydrolase [Alistipes sp.]